MPSKTRHIATFTHYTITTMYVYPKGTTTCSYTNRCTGVVTLCFKLRYNPLAPRQRSQNLNYAILWASGVHLPKDAPGISASVNSVAINPSSHQSHYTYHKLLWPQSKWRNDVAMTITYFWKGPIATIVNYYYYYKNFTVRANSKYRLR